MCIEKWVLLYQQGWLAPAHEICPIVNTNLSTWYATAFNVRLGFQHLRKLLILSTAWLLYERTTLGESESMTKALYGQ